MTELTNVPGYPCFENVSTQVICVRERGVGVHQNCFPKCLHTEGLRKDLHWYEKFNYKSYVLLNFSVKENISGGERFSSCFYSSSPLTPLRCLCSSEFCNSAPQSLFSTLPLFTISIFTLLNILKLSTASPFYITLSRCVVCL